MNKRELQLRTALLELVEACDQWHQFQHVKDDPITLACETARRVLEDLGAYRALL